MSEGAMVAAAAQGSATSTVTLVIAVTGLALASASLAWQAASFVLSGARVRAHLRRAFIGFGSALTTPLHISDDVARRTAAQGHPEPALAIIVTNRGRAPVSIDGWGILFENDFGWSNPADPMNPPLPHRLEAGTKATFYVRLAPLTAVVAASRGRGGAGLEARAIVDLATGKSVTAKGRITIQG